MRKDEDTFLRDLSYTLASKRSLFPWKTFAAATSTAQLLASLEDGLSKPVRSAAAPTVAFIFTDLLRSWGVYPRAVVGHSSGEIAAAYCAHAISRESAWRVAYFRGALSSALAMFGRHRGAMMAVSLSEDDVQQYLQRLSTAAYVTVGCVNSPKSVTLSGSMEGVVEIEKALKRDGIFCQMLRVDNAYHSKFMEEIALDYWRHLGNLQSGKPAGAQDAMATVMYSSVTGGRIDASELCDSEYWVRT